MNKQNLFPYLLLFIQPIFMASNLIVARGGVEFIPPISLAFWRWFFVFLILLSEEHILQGRLTSSIPQISHFRTISAVSFILLPNGSINSCLFLIKYNAIL